MIVTRDDAVRYSAAGTFFTDTGLAPDTTYQYTIVVRDTSGNTCREYQSTVTVGGKTEQAYGTACRQADGSWKIVN